MIETVIISPKKQDREKISSLLSSDGEIKVLALGKDGYDAIKLIGSLKPGIALLDNHLEFIDGEEIAPLLKVRSPLTAIVILTAKMSDYQLFRAASNDVSGFVCKETDMETLPRILKCISLGGCFISPALASRILYLLSTMNRDKVSPFSSKKSPGKKPEKTEERSLSKDDPMMNLSKMELQVMVQIGEGLTSDEIANKLGLTVGTVRNYVSSVMRKTGTKNRSQLARYAFCCGLVPLNPGYSFSTL
jgi:DNA-binding NarL/FixJ family response regulator